MKNLNFKKLVVIVSALFIIAILAAIGVKALLGLDASESQEETSSTHEQSSSAPTNEPTTVSPNEPTEQQGADNDNDLNSTSEQLQPSEVVASYTNEEYKIIAQLSASPWHTSSGDTEATFGNNEVTITKNGVQLDAISYAITDVSSSVTESGAATITCAFILDDSTGTLSLVNATPEDYNSWVLTCPPLFGTNSLTTFTKTGTCTLIEIDNGNADALKQSFGDWNRAQETITSWIEEHHPSATVATWQHTLSYDWEIEETSTSFVLNDKTQTVVNVTYSAAADAIIVKDAK